MWIVLPYLTAVTDQISLYDVYRRVYALYACEGHHGKVTAPEMKAILSLGTEGDVHN